MCMCVCVCVCVYTQAEQTRVISDPDIVLSLELFCALLNNNVECYEQSLTFVDDVQVRDTHIHTHTHTHTHTDI